MIYLHREKLFYRNNQLTLAVEENASTASVAMLTSVPVNIVTWQFFLTPTNGTDMGH